MEKSRLHKHVRCITKIIDCDQTPNLNKLNRRKFNDYVVAKFASHRTVVGFHSMRALKVETVSIRN